MENRGTSPRLEVRRASRRGDPTPDPPTRVIKWAILAVVTAARIERLRVLARTTPMSPRWGTFTQHEIDALILMKRRYAKRTERIPNEIPTIAQAVRWLATWADTRSQVERETRCRHPPAWARLHHSRRRRSRSLKSQGKLR